MMDVKDCFVDVVSRLFGFLGFIGVCWNLLWEVVWPPNDFKSVHGQTVLCVGTDSLARGLARRLQIRGARLVFWDNDEKALNEVEKDFEFNGEKPHVQQVDVRKHEAVSAAAAALRNAGYSVDILVHATAQPNQVDWLTEDAASVNNVVDCTLKSLIWTVRAFMPDFLKKRSGHVVCVASTTGIAAAPHVCEYSASEFGVIGFMKAVEVDTLARGCPEIQFTTLCPAFTAPDLFKNTKYAGKSRWAVSECDDVCDAMAAAVLAGRRTLIVPWQDAVLFSLQYFMSSRRFHKILARRWPYSVPLSAAAAAHPNSSANVSSSGDADDF